jgi:hypothetical protein
MRSAMRYGLLASKLAKPEGCFWAGVCTIISPIHISSYKYMSIDMSHSFDAIDTGGVYATRYVSEELTA